MVVLSKFTTDPHTSPPLTLRQNPMNFSTDLNVTNVMKTIIPITIHITISIRFLLSCLTRLWSTCTSTATSPAEGLSAQTPFLSRTVFSVEVKRVVTRPKKVQQNISSSSPAHNPSQREGGNKARRPKKPHRVQENISTLAALQNTIQAKERESIQTPIKNCVLSGSQ